MPPACAGNTQKAGRLAGAAVGAVAGLAAASKLQSKRVAAGGVLLYKELAARSDPSSLTREDVQAISDRRVCFLSGSLVDCRYAERQACLSAGWARTCP